MCVHGMGPPYHARTAFRLLSVGEREVGGCYFRQAFQLQRRNSSSGHHARRWKIDISALGPSACPDANKFLLSSLPRRWASLAEHEPHCTMHGKTYNHSGVVVIASPEEWIVFPESDSLILLLARSCLNGSLCKGYCHNATEVRLTQ